MQTGVIELHIRECEQLFDSLDPYPFYERDLDTDAEEYIVASVRELPERKASTILVHVDQPSTQPEQQRDVEQAIRNHFERKTRLAARELTELVRRGWISLVIGLAFLATLLIASEAVARSVQPGPLATVLSESLVIGGWVAMWKPLEIFLYDWWPIVGKRRLYEALSQVPVRLVAHDHDHSSGDTKEASGSGV
jgi:hypothetical protein